MVSLKGTILFHLLLIINTACAAFLHKNNISSCLIAHNSISFSKRLLYKETFSVCRLLPLALSKVCPPIHNVSWQGISIRLLQHLFRCANHQRTVRFRTVSKTWKLSNCLPKYESMKMWILHPVMEIIVGKHKKLFWDYWSSWKKKSLDELPKPRQGPASGIWRAEMLTDVSANSIS